MLRFPCARPAPYHLVARAQPAEQTNAGISLHVVYLPFASPNAGRQAETLFTAAQSLAGSPRATPVRAAIEKYRLAAAGWAVAGDREGQVLALAGEAQAWLNLSQYGNALAALHRARLVCPSNPFFRASLALLESQINLDRWDSDAALRLSREAAGLSHDLADPWLTAETLADRGEAEYLTDEPSSRTDIEKALILGRDINSAQTRARALRCRAWMESDEGRVTEAMVFMRQAEAEFRTSGQTRDAADAMANLATIRGMNGDPYAALVSHSSLIPLIRESGKLTDLAFLLINTANDYMQLNRVPDAIAYYDEAVATFRTIGVPSGESIARSQLCIAEERAGHFHQALRNCSQAKIITEQLHDPKRLANSEPDTERSFALEHAHSWIQEWGGNMCERVAMLVVHGIGEEQPYGTLDQFTRGLLKELDLQNEWAIEPVMSQEPDPTRSGRTYSRVAYRLVPPWPVDFVSDHAWSKRMEDAGAESVQPFQFSDITLFEYYWSPITKNRIKYTTSLLFLIKAGLQPFRYLASNITAI